jgi:predicted metalloprotease with PDZ domain
MTVGEKVHISLDLSLFKAHLFQITMELSAAGPMRFSMPAWTPGSYMIREFAQHIFSISAHSDGVQVPLKKINKNTFELQNTSGPLTVSYQVYAFDNSIRAAFLDDTQAFFNGTALFLRPHGYEGASYKLHIKEPTAPDQHQTQVATGLTKETVNEAGFGTYVADGFDELVDCPVQISKMERLQFNVMGVSHEMVLVGDVRKHDTERLRQDLAVLCQHIAQIFGPKLPFTTYLFIARFEENSFGGLEHRNSSMLLANPYTLPTDRNREPDVHYRSLLSLVAHEYFHAWIVKRLKPTSFVPYDLDHECYTSMLWLFEGFTAYYDDLMVVRAGLIGQSSYLNLLAKSMSNVKRTPGRMHQSLSESSFDAWIKFYRPNENSSNAGISYYLKGSLLGLYLDLTLRLKTENKRNLDLVMAEAFARYGHGQGITESQFLSILGENVDVNVDEIKEKYIDGTEDLPLIPLLNQFGVTAMWTSDDDASADLSLATDNQKRTAWYGWRYRFEGNRAILQGIDSDSPAMQAGLSPQDEIVALNQIRFDEKNAADLLASLKPHDPVSVYYFRHKKLHTCNLVGTDKPMDTLKLYIKREISPQEASMLKGWLGGKAATPEKAARA